MRAVLVDPEAVRRRLREIDRRVQDLRSLAGAGRDRFFRDRALQAQAERHLQLALQATIDIALHISAEEAARPPEDYGSAFFTLVSLKVIDEELANRLRRAAGLRNILVHAYLEVDPKQLWGHLTDLEVVESYAAAVNAYLAG